MTLKVLNLIAEVSETKHLVLHESCECKCALNESACNSLQKWNHNEFWCDCRELGGCGSCINDHIWNPSTWDCECNKAYKVHQYLDIEYCLCGKRLFDKLILICKDEILSTTKTLLYNKNSNI